MSSDNALFMQLEQELQRLVSTAKPSYRRSMARKLSRVIQLDQQKRIRSQKNPDGSSYASRRRKVLRAQLGIHFVWKGEERVLKNWRATRGRGGRMVTGHDEERGAVRSFYRKDIERYLSIDRSATRKTSRRDYPMFRRLRAARYLRATATPSAAVVGFQGRAAAIARQHQYGLTGSINELAKVRYPKRELLGLSPHERMTLIDVIYRDLLEGL